MSDVAKENRLTAFAKEKQPVEHLEQFRGGLEYWLE